MEEAGKRPLEDVLPSAPQQADELSFSPGDRCETLTVLTLRSDESILSDVITELPQGLGLQVVALGSSKPRLRAHVRAGRLEGWITARTSSMQAHIRRRSSELPATPEDLQQGARYQVAACLPVRAGRALDSPLLGELPAGAAVRLLEVGESGCRNRARVKGEDLEGWITVVNYMGQVLLTRPSRSRGRARTTSFSGPSAVKSLLELAKAGDAQGLQKLIEGSGEAEAPDINCADVRGRTSLMLAAGAGSCDTARYILSRRGARVNELDDTQKTALHYAARQAWSELPRAAEASQRPELVRLLVAGGASVDARDHSGCTALMLAAASGDVGVVRALLDAGANVNAKDYEERPALAYASSLGRAEVSKCLLEAGAEDMENELFTPPRLSLAVSGQRRSMGLRQSVLVRGQSSCRGRASILSRRSTLASLASQCSGRRPTRQSAFWTTGLAVGSEAEPAEVIAIEEPDAAPEVSEAELARERALARLAAVMAEGEAAAPVELEQAIAEAEAAGAESEDLEKARERVEFLRERAAAHDVLLAAIAERSCPALRDAIAKAQEKRVPDAEVDRARAVLAEEEPKEKALERLGAAQDKGDTTSLREALAEASKAGIPEEELQPFEDLLRGAESKEQAESALDDAIEEKDVVALRFALDQARAAGANAELIKQGEEVLAVEEPLYEARRALEEMQEGASIEEMRALLARAQQAGLEKEEYADLEELLRREEERERMLAEVSQALEEVKDVDMHSVAAVTAARDRLAAVVQTAQNAGASEADVKAANIRRRKLHNAIQDLKGAIRVFCRVRPLSGREKNLNDERIVHANEDGLSLRVEDRGQEKKIEAHEFSFDAVFAPGTQEEVFEEAKDLVQSALDGYNVTIFAYGQTGAGKTFTMYGAPGMEGTAPRTIRELYRLVDHGRDRFAYTVMGSMMELYRNDLVDLLVLKKRPSAPKTTAHQKLNVHMSKAGNVVIDHLTEEECASAEDLSDLLERGNAQRTVAATAMNSESSRSHLLVVIQIVCVNRETGEQVRGKILMCDLAGSERLKKSEVTGDMQKEAIEINKSLTALGDVIECLTKAKGGHVPYRNHTLTQVMQDALGGTSKTLMFLNCSPASSNSDETLMALKYATRAKKISNDTRRKTADRL